jgi:hypothetical protein
LNVRAQRAVLLIIPILILISFTISCQSDPETISLETAEVPNIVSSQNISAEKQEIKSLETGELTNPEKQEESPVNLTDQHKIEIFPYLSDSSIEKIILNTIPGSFLPVTNDNGNIKIIYSDLDQNGYKDAFFLVLKNRENLNSNYSKLSDLSNLLNEDQREVDFFLAVYLQLQCSMTSMYRIPIGSSDVISNFSIFPIKKGEIIPLGINISFQTLKGINSEWIIFSSYNKFSLFSMTENISSHSIVSDIDGDGILDIIGWEDGLEEGTGYETYLSWFKWNGKEYREYQSTTIVRNLNGFLEQARLYLSFKQIDEFLNYSLNLKNYNEIKKSEDSSFEWIDRVFRPVPGSESEEDYLKDCGKIHSIVFPQIFENPFSPIGDSLKICNINVRFECSDGYTYIRTARIQMNPNPFAKPQFSFYLE